MDHKKLQQLQNIQSSNIIVSTNHSQKPFSKYTLFPSELIQKVNKQLWNFQQSHFSYFQLSHRSQYYSQINNKANDLVRKYLEVPQDYKIMFMVSDSIPTCLMYNLFSENQTLQQRKINFIVNGKRGQFAFQQATNFVQSHQDCKVQCQKFLKEEQRIQFFGKNEDNSEKNIIFTHYNMIEPFEGIKNHQLEPCSSNQILICDLTFSENHHKINIKKHGIVYFQSYSGFSLPGISIVIVNQKLIGKHRKDCPDMFQFQLTNKMSSIINTPNTLTTLLLKQKLDFWMKNNMSQQENYQRLKKIKKQNIKALKQEKMSLENLFIEFNFLEDQSNQQSPINFLSLSIKIKKDQNLTQEVKNKRDALLQKLNELARNSYTLKNFSYQEDQIIVRIFIQLENQGYIISLSKLIQS